MKLFGTDGIRGIANDKLSPELALKLGQILASQSNIKRPKILVGKDTRISCDMLESAISAGICSAGGDAVLLGIIPTPAVAYLTRNLNFDYGIMISASHNPMEYNGIKIFDNKGFKLSDSSEERLEKCINDSSYSVTRQIGSDIGQTFNGQRYKDHYIQFLQSISDFSLNNRTILLDCANGASYKIATQIFSDLGAKLIVKNTKPDGCNINQKCGSTYIESLKKDVINSGADFAFAFDGDADRVLAMDANGKVVDGDQILAILALDMKQTGILNKNTIVTTVMSNLGLMEFAKKNEIQIITTKVGDRYVLENMFGNDYRLGGEQSGHIILSDYATTGDGLVTALILTAVIAKTGKKLSELASVMQIFPQVLVNVKVNDYIKNNYLDFDEIKQKISDIDDKISLNNTGRLLIRASGTEPLIRIMAEGKDKTKIEEYVQELAQTFKKYSNVEVGEYSTV